VPGNHDKQAVNHNDPSSNLRLQDSHAEPATRRS
jgi:hypothetical protein